MPNRGDNRSFMIWLPPCIHEAIREKLWRTKKTARAVTISFLQHYTGHRCPLCDKGMIPPAVEQDEGERVK